MNKLDQDILDLQELKRTLVSLERLNRNPDFQRVILKNFLEEHPLALIKSKGVLGIKPETVVDIERQLDCVALFNKYLQDLNAQIADIDLKIAEAETLRANETRN